MAPTTNPGPYAQMDPEAARPTMLRRQSTLSEMSANNPQTTSAVASLLLGLGPAAVYFALWGVYGDIPCDKPIKSWLFWSALCGVLVQTLNFVMGPTLQKYQKEAKEAQEAQRPPPDMPGSLPPFFCVLCGVGIFGLVWFIMGNVWVWNSTEDECGELSRVTKILLIVQYSLGGFICVMSCCVGCCAAIFVASQEGQPMAPR